MRELILMIALAVGFCSQALAETAVTGARVVSSGEMGKPGTQDIQARPGVRFGLELVPEGAPGGSSVVLEGRLLRPQDVEGMPPVRWMVAARIGVPVQIVWEFAYDWEVEPGVWTMKVFHEEKELASVPFAVVRASTPLQEPKSQNQRDGRQAKPGESQSQAPIRDVGAKVGIGQAGGPAISPEPKATPEADKTPARPGDAAAGPAAKNAPVDSLDSAASSSKTSTGKTQADPGKADVHERKQPEHLKSEIQGQENARRVVGGKPDRRVYALMCGAYSEEARALRAASLLKARGVTPCLRVDSKNGKKLWHVVAGWRDSPEDARKAKAKLTPVLGEVFVQPMSAKELETGLICR